MPDNVNPVGNSVGNANRDLGGAPKSLFSLVGVE
jgi:hypothetical protein